MNPIIYVSIVLAICGLAIFIYAYFLKPNVKRDKTTSKQKEQKTKEKEKEKPKEKPPKKAPVKKAKKEKPLKKAPVKKAEKEKSLKKKPIKRAEKESDKPFLEIKDKENEKQVKVKTKEKSSKNPFKKIKFAGLTNSILSIISKGKLSKDDELAIEEILLSSDVGYDNAHSIIEQLKVNLEKKLSPKDALEKELVDILKIDKPREIALSNDKKKPTVIIVVGVNGVGKTTTIGKLGKQFKEQGKSVIFGAADTFRAAAVDQLQEWSKRVGADFLANVSTDPAAIAYQTVQKAIDENIDIALIDTAGRLANKTNLMEELKKVHRVIEKLTPVNEILLVLDATVGQNGYKQSDAFYEAVNVSGIVLTKLDGSAKGGIVISVQKELNIPVKFVGIGEQIDDLKKFNEVEFAKQIV